LLEKTRGGEISGSWYASPSSPGDRKRGSEKFGEEGKNLDVSIALQPRGLGEELMGA